MALAVLAAGTDRVEVAGGSMRPTLEPGDRLLVWRTRRVGVGQLVVLTDPRRPDRPLVKRVTCVDPDGSVTVAGDNPAASMDSRAFGSVARASIQGRALYRYHPPARAGWVGAARPL